jgi:hypothetical protein
MSNKIYSFIKINYIRSKLTSAPPFNLRVLKLKRASVGLVRAIISFFGQIRKKPLTRLLRGHLTQHKRVYISKGRPGLMIGHAYPLQCVMPCNLVLYTSFQLKLRREVHFLRNITLPCASPSLLFIEPRLIAYSIVYGSFY